MLQLTPEPLVDNRAIEDAAISYVLELERTAGRQPQDKRAERAFPGDILSPPRTIEVKAIGGNQRGWFLPVEVRQYDAAMSNPEFYVYVVDNIKQENSSGYRLKVFAGEQLLRLLSRAKKREYYEMPVPVAEFDSAPGVEAVTGGSGSG